MNAAGDAAANTVSSASMQGKYAGKLNMDSVLIAVMLVLLYGVQLFLVYSVLSATKPVLSGYPGLVPVFILFVGLMFIIETIGCLRVRQSIKQHMHEFRYYD